MFFSSVETALKRTYQVSIGSVCSKTLTGTKCPRLDRAPAYEIRDSIAFLIEKAFAIETIRCILGASRRKK
jgi:hypothetical protein